MWNLTNTPPQLIEARVLTRMPDSFRRKQRTEWSDANKPGHEVDSFIEGPTFDRAGNLYINRGLGHLMAVRFNARPEITLFTLVPQA